MQFDPANPQAHYAAIKAKFNKPSSGVVMKVQRNAAPPPVKQEYQPRPDDVLDAEILRLKKLMEGCRIPARLRLLVLPLVEECNIPWKVLVSPSREKYLKDARPKIWTALRDDGLSYPQIGKMFNRDHTSIMYGIREYENASR